MKRLLTNMFRASGLLLASFVFSTVSAQGVAAPDAEKGEELYVNGDMSRGILSCASCHGAEGNSTMSVYPNLAGMSHEYIVKQLNDFVAPKDGHAARRGVDGADAIMTPFATALSDEDKANVAFYLTQQKLDLETAAVANNTDTIERGQQIWRGGIPDRKVPACAACHSANGAGMPGEFPRLAGQFPEYISEQLNLFRSGYRDNDDMMHDIADRMTDADIAAVADYAAGLR